MAEQPEFSRAIRFYLIGSLPDRGRAANDIDIVPPFVVCERDEQADEELHLRPCEALSRATGKPIDLFLRLPHDGRGQCLGGECFTAFFTARDGWQLRNRWLEPQPVPWPPPSYSFEEIVAMAGGSSEQREFFCLDCTNSVVDEDYTVHDHVWAAWVWGLSTAICASAASRNGSRAGSPASTSPTAR